MEPIFDTIPNETYFKGEGIDDIIINNMILTFISNRKHPKVGEINYCRIDDTICKSDAFQEILNNSYNPIWKSSSDTDSHIINVFRIPKNMTFVKKNVCL